MNTISKEWLDFMRQQYPVGSRIKLRSVGDGAPDALKPGAMGTLERIGEDGDFHVAWDSGDTLPLVIGQDSFTVSPPPLQTLKLYMPLTVGYFVDEDGCGWSNEEYTIDPGEAVEYAPQIIAAMQKENDLLLRQADSPEEVERGLMAYYGRDDGVDRKVQSYRFKAEVRDGQLWGVAECQVRGELTPDELEKLKDDIAGQAADGFGEGVEQREIEINGGLELFAHLWHSGKDWSIQTEQERFSQQAQTPPQMGGMDFA